MNKGIIIKIDSNISYILSNQQIYNAFARNSIKKQNPVVGDKVIFDIIDFEQKIVNIIELETRQNIIYRPRVANVDQVAIVISLKEPNFSSFLLIKYVTLITMLKIVPLIIFNKNDLLSNSQEDLEIIQKLEYFKNQNINFECLSATSSNEKELLKLNSHLKNKITLFAGQTGAGKSTIINLFLPYENKLRTQEISKSLNRGKHTTTSAQIHLINQDILLIDSPGFSSFNLKDVSRLEFSKEFYFFKNFIDKCKFNDCLHIKEQECFIKELIDIEIPTFIYEDYLKIQNELLENNVDIWSKHSEKNPKKKEK